jgi:membrane protein required for colicin V production
MDTLGWLDLCVGVAILASALVGLWRGVVYELLSLAGWLIAWWTAQRFGAELGAAVLGDSLQPALRGSAGWVLMFVLALVAWRLMTWVLQRLLHASPLAPVDRGLGGVFGLLRGIVMVLAVVMLVGLTPLAQRPAWRDAPSVQWAQAVLQVVSPVLPGDWVRRPSPPHTARGVAQRRDDEVMVLWRSAMRSKVASPAAPSTALGGALHGVP